MSRKRFVNYQLTETGLNQKVIQILLSKNVAMEDASDIADEIVSLVFSTSEESAKKDLVDFFKKLNFTDLKPAFSIN